MHLNTVDYNELNK